ncbi:MAG: glucuronate isomerase [Candidatus Methylacidiphilales bacterium]|nr:glucuronate isomerase [Candidatus Methylacidiphilales bacterium]
MNSFHTPHFLLQTESARELYHNHAAPTPIFDFRCHLPPAQIAANKRFRNLYELWVEGDTCKHQVMRANGIPEQFITGEASDFEKFLAFATTLPYALRHPLYHSAHLELFRNFGISEALDEHSARSIWNNANEQLSSPEMYTHGLLEKENVVALCTMEDPTDSLFHHQTVRETSLGTQVYPTFCPRQLQYLNSAAAFRPWLQSLEEVSGQSCATLKGFLAALEQRHDCFHQLGSRISCYRLDMLNRAIPMCSDAQAGEIFQKARMGLAVSAAEADQLRMLVMLFLARLDADRGWTLQLQLEACDDRATETPEGIVAFLNALDATEQMPRLLFTAARPGDSELFASVISTFLQRGTSATATPHRMHIGTAWQYLERAGTQSQLDLLSRISLLRRFVGISSDSSVFLSFSRHEFFRRHLCNLLGREMETGLLPSDMELMGKMVREICFENTKQYLGMEVGNLGFLKRSLGREALNAEEEEIHSGLRVSPE